MANLETAQETRAAREQLDTVDLVIGIPASTDEEELRRKSMEAVSGLLADVPGCKVMVAYPGTPSAELPEATQLDSQPASLRFLEYSLPQGTSAKAPWLGLTSAYRALSEIAVRAGASTCAILGADLSVLDASSLQMLARPVLEQRAALAMPIYTVSKFEALLNSAILYPMTRALYGKRVRYPLALDFAISSQLLSRLAVEPTHNAQAAAAESIVWPSTEAAITNSPVIQVQIGRRHTAQNDSLDLSTILAHLVGSLFSDVEKHAALWQRVRGSQQITIVGDPPPPASDSDSVDVRPLLDSFNLGSRNLQEVWSLVLPPVTLLDLKRLSRVTPENFRIPDALWVRIMYDFALAYRLRTISRAHLLGALTPLYLGWVASYALEVGSSNAYFAEQRIEQLAKAYEDGKPYLVSRWRWPDRFNP